MSFEVPILLCIYNRPQVTARTFAEIAKRKPKHLLIAGDGPRMDRPTDFEQVELARQVVRDVDWDCNLQACFLNENLGCRKQMARAISWGFSQFEQMIILEDDCLPDPSFFSFCQQLLERYASRHEVMTIAGINHLNLPGTNDYRFSKYPFIWGWASWRRAWRHYDLEMSQWRSPEVQANVLSRFTESPSEQEYWHQIFEAQSQGKIDTWDYSWTFASWLNQGLTIVPRDNLVSNIGFGLAATHTVDGSSQLANFPTRTLTLSNHPDSIRQDKEWDRVARGFYFPKQQTISINASHKPQSITSQRSLLSRIFRRASRQHAA
jgi:hypothetical protein